MNPKPLTIMTPTGSWFEGECIDTHAIVAVSIIRAGDSLLDCFIKVAPAAHIGKILIQRDEETHQPVLFYSKLPSLIDKQIVLCDPMLATGGSAKAAIGVLLDNGANEENIMFLNVVACPEGIEAILTAFPKVKIVTGEIDSGLNEKVSRLNGKLCNNFFHICGPNAHSTIRLRYDRHTLFLDSETMGIGFMGHTNVASVEAAQACLLCNLCV